MPSTNGPSPGRERSPHGVPTTGRRHGRGFVLLEVPTLAAGPYGEGAYVYYTEVMLVHEQSNPIRRSCCAAWRSVRHTATSFLPFLVLFTTMVLLCATFPPTITAVEARLIEPLTTPKLHQTVGSLVDPSTGLRTPVLPVFFSVTTNYHGVFPDLYDPTNASSSVDAARAVGTINGGVLRNELFTNATIVLSFDVPNPGLDFLLNFSSSDYPLLMDSFYRLWRPKFPLRVTFIKESTMFTYDTGNIGVGHYQSKSESEEYVAGQLANDAQCASVVACCPVNATHYKRYRLVDSPVPPYTCTGAPIDYSLPLFSFSAAASTVWDGDDSTTNCLFTGEAGGDVAETSCVKSSTRSSIPLFSPRYVTPSTSFAVCRCGSDMIGSGSCSEPFPVGALSFCPSTRCIGYTEENYRKDRLSCGIAPLGSLSSQDGNNTNQFSSFETEGSSQWPITFQKCRWIDEVTMSSPTTMKELSLQCDINASKGWSLTYDDFSGRVLDLFEPTFPFGRATRVTARLDASRKLATGVIVEVEYVAFSPVVGPEWGLYVRFSGRNAWRPITYPEATSVPFRAVGTNDYQPQLMSTTVELPLSVRKELSDNSRYVVEVEVNVSDWTALTYTPFLHMVLSVKVDVEEAPPAASVVTVDPRAGVEVQRLPQFYKGTDTSRLVCIGDYVYASGKCVVMQSRECAAKYPGWRTMFSVVQLRCIPGTPQLTLPLKYTRPPRATRRFLTPEERRARLTGIPVPPFMKSMEQAVTEVEARMEENKATAAPAAANVMQSASRVTSKGATTSSDAQPVKSTTGDIIAPFRAGSITLEELWGLGRAAAAAEDASRPRSIIQLDASGVISIVLLLWTSLFGVLMLARDPVERLLGIDVDPATAQSDGNASTTSSTVRRALPSTSSSSSSGHVKAKVKEALLAAGHKLKEVGHAVKQFITKAFRKKRPTRPSETFVFGPSGVFPQTTGDYGVLWSQNHIAGAAAGAGVGGLGVPQGNGFASSTMHGLFAQPGQPQQYPSAFSLPVRQPPQPPLSQLSHVPHHTYHPVLHEPFGVEEQDVGLYNRPQYPSVFVPQPTGPPPPPPFGTHTMAEWYALHGMHPAPLSPQPISHVQQQMRQEHARENEVAARLAQWLEGVSAADAPEPVPSLRFSEFPPPPTLANEFPGGYGGGGEGVDPMGTEFYFPRPPVQRASLMEAGPAQRSSQPFAPSAAPPPPPFPPSEGLVMNPLQENAIIPNTMSDRFLSSQQPRPASRPNTLHTFVPPATTATATATTTRVGVGVEAQLRRRVPRGNSPVLNGGGQSPPLGVSPSYAAVAAGDAAFELPAAGYTTVPPGEMGPSFPDGTGHLPQQQQQQQMGGGVPQTQSGFTPQRPPAATADEERQAAFSSSLPQPAAPQRARRSSRPRSHHSTGSPGAGADTTTTNTAATGAAAPVEGSSGASPAPRPPLSQPTQTDATTHASPHHPPPPPSAVPTTPLPVNTTSVPREGGTGGEQQQQQAQLPVPTTQAGVSQQAGVIAGRGASPLSIDRDSTEQS